MSHGSLFDSYLNSRTGKSDDCKMVTFRFSRDLRVCESVGRRQRKEKKKKKERESKRPLERSRLCHLRHGPVKNVKMFIKEARAACTTSPHPSQALIRGVKAFRSTAGGV